MKTPICDFLKEYNASMPRRFHMPGHKGISELGFEPYDLTEIDGADSLYEAGGIIAESERAASALFGCPTYYSTEGSSQGIRAMLYLATTLQRTDYEAPCVIATQNAHKAFLYSAALLDFDIEWLPDSSDNYHSCQDVATILEAILSSRIKPPAAVYITSPDYLGNLQDIRELATICHRHDTILLVDNAHGAYLHFLPTPQHPMDLGADLCCDSAHKTLPVITGGAYLHISPRLEERYCLTAKQALELFGSTSPSYLTLASLDHFNGYDAYPADLVTCIHSCDTLKAKLQAHGYELTGQEPIKITLCPKSFGYTGHDIARILAESNIYTEFHDPDFVVLMISPQNSPEDLSALEAALTAIPRKPAITEKAPTRVPTDIVLSPREALLLHSYPVPVEESVGHLLAFPSVSCPPAIPICACGDRIREEHVAVFQYYGIQTVWINDNGLK